MQTRIIQKHGQTIAVVEDQTVLVKDAQSALDLMMTVRYETGADRIILDKKLLAEDFFILRTGLAGEILQKVVNYQMKLAVCGDFSRYTSKPLQDFIYESNHGNSVFFVADEQEAASRLSQAR